MAIPVHAPAITRSRQLVAEKSSQAVLRLVPDIKAGEKADRKTFVIFLSSIGAIGLLLLLAINTMLAQDAFELHRLQAQATTLSDQREAVMRQIDFASSPEELAARATAQGMVPSQSPRFLTLNSSSANPAAPKG
ncbi:MAG TPA: hypothetical protein VGJ85_02270 [Candidatus Nanopelagicaceae bacterium]|jgi:hypothetical protein